MRSYNYSNKTACFWSLLIEVIEYNTMPHISYFVYLYNNTNMLLSLPILRIVKHFQTFWSILRLTMYTQTHARTHARRACAQYSKLRVKRR